MNRFRSPSRFPLLVKRRLLEWRNAIRRIPSQSRLKVSVITASAILFETGLFFLFKSGFRFIHSFGGPGALLLGRLFALYFLAMGILLVLSSLVAAYGSLFRSGDLDYLLVAPIDLTDIINGKWVEIAGIASWAYIFIVAPFVAAYAAFEGISLWFVAWTIAFSIPWLLLCAALGTILALCMARWFPKPGPIRRLLWILLGIGLALATFRLISGWDRQAAIEATRLRNIIPGLQLATHPLTPGFWITEGIFAMRDGLWIRGARFFLLLCANAMAAGVLLEIISERWFPIAWTRMKTASTRGRPSRLLPITRTLLGFLPADARALIVKDMRVFWRDPLQWSQSLVFFGLLAVYFANLRNFYTQAMEPLWQNFVAFLNAFSLSAVLCSLTSRFVYPQVSLEGQAYWLLGLSPTRASRIVMTKFFTALTALTCVTVPLMGLSTGMLETPVESRVSIMVLIVCLTLAVCGLATGLGTIFADLEHRNPAAVVSGFGGTLNLVLNLMITVSLLAPFAFLFHLRATGNIPAPTLHRILRFALPGAVALSVIVAAIPLRLGIRSLSRRDF